MLSLTEAAQRIAAGELVAFPTETVYGLGADADQRSAVAKIFATKGRPSDHPLIVHVLDQRAARHYAHHWPEFATRLAEGFWPGPLTLILARRPGIAEACAGGQDSIGIRCPAHPLARDLLAQCVALGVKGVAAPSANRFGKVSPTTAGHVKAEFGAEVEVLDGGPCDVGIESTIIDCTRGVPVLLRPGVLTVSEIEAVLGQRLIMQSDTTGVNPDLAPTSSLATLPRPAPRSSGSLESHYAPVAPLRLMNAKALQTALDVLGKEAKHIAVYARTPLKLTSSEVVVRRMPSDAVSVARQLFAVLRDFDAQGVRLIWVEEVPSLQEWDGVRDRLQRAAA